MKKSQVASIICAMSDKPTTYPSRTADQFVVRFPDGMRDRLKEAAEAAGRSQNAEIVSRLATSFEQNPNAEALQLQIQHLEQRIKDLKHGLLLEATLGALTALSLKELSQKIPPELRDALSAASAESLADRLLQKPSPDPDSPNPVQGLDEVEQMMRRFLEEARATAGAMSSEPRQW